MRGALWWFRACHRPGSLRRPCCFLCRSAKHKPALTPYQGSWKWESSYSWKAANTGNDQNLASRSWIAWTLWILLMQCWDCQVWWAVIDLHFCWGFFFFWFCAGCTRIWLNLCEITSELLSSWLRNSSRCSTWEKANAWYSFSHWRIQQPNSWHTLS